jgi:hypothetical protein
LLATFLKGNIMEALGFGMWFCNYNIYVVDDYGNFVSVDAMQSIVSTRDVMQAVVGGDIPSII